jgi:putative membrane protein
VRALAAIGFLCGLVLAIGLVLANGVGAIWQSLLRLVWTGFAAVIGFHLCLIALMGLAWWLLGRNRVDAAPWRFIWGRLIRDSASEALPLSQLGGFILGARALALTGTSGIFAAAATVVDVTVELVAQLVYTGLGLLLLERLRPDNSFARPALIGVVAMTVAVAAFIAVQAKGAGLVERISNRVSRELLGKDLAQAGGVQASIRALHTRHGALLVATSLHGVCWLLSAVETWVTLRLMSVPLSLPAALIIDSLLYGMRSMAFLVPNAVGVQEGGLMVLGGMFGVNHEASLAVSLVKRGRDLVIGIPALLIWQTVESRRAFHRKVSKQRLTATASDGDLSAKHGVF